MKQQCTLFSVLEYGCIACARNPPRRRGQRRACPSNLRSSGVRAPSGLSADVQCRVTELSGEGRALNRHAALPIMMRRVSGFTPARCPPIENRRILSEDAEICSSPSRVRSRGPSRRTAAVAESDPLIMTLCALHRWHEHHEEVGEICRDAKNARAPRPVAILAFLGVPVKRGSVLGCKASRKHITILFAAASGSGI